MSDEKLAVSPADVALASLNLVNALIMQLSKDGVLTPDKVNFVGAVAASMCRANGSDGAGKLIENVMPSSAGLNVSIEAMKQGIEITREPKK